MHLHPTYTFETEEKDKTVANVLGQYRYDGIFLIPFFEETQSSQIIMDYAVNRNDFLLGKLEAKYPDELGKLITFRQNLEYPDKVVYQRMLFREYPLFESVIN